MITPAFPTTLYNGDTDKPYSQVEGMTLRDYFASHASEKDIETHQAPWTTIPPKREGLWETMVPDCDRETAKFRYADAMMQARRSK